jgi:hypothetical protein
MRDGDLKVREEAIGGLVEIYAERDRITPSDASSTSSPDEYDRSVRRALRGRWTPSAYQAAGGTR